MMKKVMLTVFAILGVASLIVGSTVTNGKFYSTQHTVLTILDTMPKPDSAKSKTNSYTRDTIANQDLPIQTGFIAGF